MPRHIEQYTGGPLRPATADYKIASDFTIPIDTGGVDWTAAGTRIPLTSNTKHMDDKKRITTGTEVISVEPGVYRVELHPVVQNTEASNNENIQLAITNGAGSVVYATTPEVECQAPDEAQPFYLVAHVHRTTAGSFAVRAAQTSDNEGGATAECKILAGGAGNSPVCHITRIGNVNET